MCFSATASFSAGALLLDRHADAEISAGCASASRFAIRRDSDAVRTSATDRRRHQADLQPSVSGRRLPDVCPGGVSHWLAAHGSARRIRFTALLRGRDDDAVPVVDRSGLSPLWRAQARSPSIKGQRHVGTSFTGGLNAAPALPKQRFGPSPDGSGLCAGRRSHATVLTHE